jgi:hypothetical protein
MCQPKKLYSWICHGQSNEFRMWLEWYDALDHFMESWIGGAMKGILVNNGLECLEELIYFPTFQC